MRENSGSIQRCIEEVGMELSAHEHDLLGNYLASFVALTGDRRTAALLDGMLRGIIASESPICARIAAFSPSAGHGPAERAADSTDVARRDDPALGPRS